MSQGNFKLNDSQKAVVGGFAIFAIFTVLFSKINRLMEIYEACTYPFVVVFRRGVLFIGTVFIVGSCVGGGVDKNKTQVDTVKTESTTKTEQTTAKAQVPYVDERAPLPSLIRENMGLVLMPQIEGNGLMVVEPALLKIMMDPQGKYHDVVTAMTPMERVALLSYDPRLTASISDVAAGTFVNMVIHRFEKYAEAKKAGGNPTITTLGGVNGVPKLPDEMIASCTDQWYHYCKAEPHIEEVIEQTHAEPAAPMESTVESVDVVEPDTTPSTSEVPMGQSDRYNLLTKVESF